MEGAYLWTSWLVLNCKSPNPSGPAEGLRLQQRSKPQILQLWDIRSTQKVTSPIFFGGGVMSWANPVSGLGIQKKWGPQSCPKSLSEADPAPAGLDAQRGNFPAIETAHSSAACSQNQKLEPSPLFLDRKKMGGNIIPFFNKKGVGLILPLLSIHPPGFPNPRGGALLRVIWSQHPDSEQPLSFRSTGFSRVF